MACPPFSLLFFLVFLLPFHAVSQTKDANTKPIGSSLSASEINTTWLSPSGDFAFGFQQVQDKDQFMLSIWYNYIPGKTMVWFVYQTVQAGSKVNLTADRGLVLSDSLGKVLGSSSLSGTASYGVLNDAGNFMIVGSNSSKLWDTFSNPTDTLLPTQIMDIGGVLYSKKSDTDFSRGRFQLRFNESGVLELITRDIVTGVPYYPYYSSDNTDPTNTSNSGYQLRFNETGFLSITMRNGVIFDLTTKALPPSGNYYRATLDVDGVFVHYSHPKNSSGTGTPNWDVVWRQPQDICLAINGELGSGACGYNSFCSQDGYGHKVCSCPTGYTLVDPDDKYGSCKPNISQSCDDDNGKSNDKDSYYFVEVLNANCPRGDYEKLSQISESDCINSCLNDCFCAIVEYGLSTTNCFKKRLPFSNGRTGSTETGKILLKIKKDPRKMKSATKKDHGTFRLIGSALLGSSVLANVILIGAVCFGCFSIYRKKAVVQNPLNNVVETNLRCFTYNELRVATDGFKEELGRGAFGIVYKGVLPMFSSNIVAVKKLDRLVQEREKEFKIEINVIAQTHHKNLVRLLGFCEDGEHRLLVYEFMANGTLSSYLFGDVRPSWAHRSSIAVAIARGLAYLHEECSTQIIHCDIKPQNILLDEYYNARISDFGLAKLLKINQSRTDTAIRGTRGYVAPDWFRNSPITVKVDVYSFGVLLMEIICCRRSVEDVQLGGEKDILIDWVWDCFQEGRLDLLVENEEDVMNEWSKFEIFVMVGIWCIQEDPSLRPTMRKVIQMLEGVVNVPKPPCPSFYS